jgi:PPM family protein phosphatase
MSCAACGFEANPQDRFCEGCGLRLSSTTAPSEHVAFSAALPSCACGSATFDAEGSCTHCRQKDPSDSGLEVLAADDGLAWASHVGRRHAENQDAAAGVRLPDGAALMVLADGVSSAERAREAAALVVRTVIDTLLAHDRADPESALKEAVREAHEALLRLPHTDMHKDEPQTTIVAALCIGHGLWYSWVGDSRLYVITATQVELVTEDDSWLNDALNRGIPLQTAMHSRDAHCITQCLGMREEIPTIHTGATTLEAGSYVLLCSDGLWNYMTEPSVLGKQFLWKDGPNPLQSVCREMVSWANELGGVDNITVAVTQVPPG